MELGGDGGDPPQQHQNMGFFSEGADAALNPSQALNLDELLQLYTVEDLKKFVPITAHENHKANLLQSHAIQCHTPVPIQKVTKLTRQVVGIAKTAPYTLWPGGDARRASHWGPHYARPGTWFVTPTGPRHVNGVSGPRPNSPEPDYSSDEDDETIPDPSKM